MLIGIRLSKLVVWPQRQCFLWLWYESSSRNAIQFYELLMFILPSYLLLSLLTGLIRTLYLIGLFVSPDSYCFRWILLWVLLVIVVLMAIITPNPNSDRPHRLLMRIWLMELIFSNNSYCFLHYLFSKSIGNLLNQNLAVFLLPHQIISLMKYFIGWYEKISEYSS